MSAIYQGLVLETTGCGCSGSVSSLSSVLLKHPVFNTMEYHHLYNTASTAINVSFSRLLKK